jgi:hypothetical protein
LDTELRVSLAAADGAVTPVSLVAHSGAPDTFTGTVYPSQGGRFTLAASIHAGDRMLANKTTEFLVRGSNLELAYTRVDRNRLRAIAAHTGGVYYDVDDAGGLADQVRPEARRTVRLVHSELWNSPWLFVVFLAAITTEWVIRRRNQLV